MFACFVLDKVGCQVCQRKTDCYNIQQTHKVDSGHRERALGHFLLASETALHARKQYFIYRNGFSHYHDTSILTRVFVVATDTHIPEARTAVFLNFPLSLTNRKLSEAVISAMLFLPVFSQIPASDSSLCDALIGQSRGICRNTGGLRTACA